MHLREQVPSFHYRARYKQHRGNGVAQQATVNAGGKLQKATKLNAAMLALCNATTVPLAKPPLMVEAGKAMEEFTNRVSSPLPVRTRGCNPRARRCPRSDCPSPR